MKYFVQGNKYKMKIVVYFEVTSDKFTAHRMCMLCHQSNQYRKKTAAAATNSNDIGHNPTTTQAYTQN
jgi:hypothetical protein